MVPSVSAPIPWGGGTLERALRRAANADADLARVQKTLDGIRARGADYEQRYRTAEQQYRETLEDVVKYRDQLAAAAARIEQLERELAEKKGA